MTHDRWKIGATSLVNVTSWSPAAGVCAGAIAGIIVTPITLMQYDTGLLIGLKGFVACIIGGFGNPIGALFGGLLLGIVESLSAGYLSSGYKNAIAFVLLLGFLIFRPEGIFREMDSRLTKQER